MDPTYKICLASKLQKATRGSGFHTDHRCGALGPAKCFGDRITADHAILNEDNKSAGEENLVGMHHSRCVHGDHRSVSMSHEERG